MNKSAVFLTAVQALQLTGHMVTVRSDCACAPGIHLAARAEWDQPDEMPQQSPGPSTRGVAGASGSGVSSQVSVMADSGLDFTDFPDLISFRLP